VPRRPPIPSLGRGLESVKRGTGNSRARHRRRRPCQSPSAARLAFPLRSDRRRRHRHDRGDPRVGRPQVGFDQLASSTCTRDSGRTRAPRV